MQQRAERSSSSSGTIILAPAARSLHYGIVSLRSRNHAGVLCANVFSISVEHYRAGAFRIEGNNVLASVSSASYGRYDFRRRWFPSLQLQQISTKRPKDRRVEIT